MVGADEFESVKMATETFFEIQETIQPNAELASLYAAEYEKYRKIYPAVKNLYQEIRD